MPILLLAAAALSPAPVLAATPMSGMAVLTEQVQRGVVNIEVLERGAEPPLALDPWDRTTPTDVSMRPSAGSGFLFDARGIIATNFHLVRNALSLRIRFSDGRQLPAQLVGGDEASDVAFVRLVGTFAGLSPLPLGDSESLKVGDWVMALGNPSGQTVTASVGVLSGKGRHLQQGPWADFLQTDAAIHPGNTGGPLLNLQGQVVGINTALLGGSSGVSFAAPSGLLRTLLPQLLRAGHVARAWLGAYVSDITPPVVRRLHLSSTSGVLVTECVRDSPAARGGLRVNDIVVSVASRNVSSVDWLVQALAAQKPGNRVRVEVRRGVEQRTLRLEVGEQPEWRPVDPPSNGAQAGILEVLGLSLEQAPEGQQGAVISFVRPGSPAAEAGLLEGSWVQEAGGKPVRSPEELNTLFREAPHGSPLLLRLQLPDLPYPRLRAVRIP